MVSYYQILLPLLSLFLVRVDLTDLLPLKMKVKVLEVYDGDTVLVSRGSYRFKVRLDKIDAPELGQLSLDGKIDAGEVSKNCLKSLLKNDQVWELKIRSHDIYRRVLGEINSMSFEMIRRGCAPLYPYALFGSRQEKFNYLRAFKKTKASRRGLWKFGGIIRPDLWRKLNKQTLRRRLRR